MSSMAASEWTTTEHALRHLARAEVGRRPAAAGLSGGQLCSTTSSVLPSGSRNQNIGGTGSPMRMTSASTSTPRACRWAWVASMSSVLRLMPVWTPVGSPGRGGASAMPVVPSVG
jgi:hypothetical protein